MTDPLLVQKDSRGRLPLGQLADADRYLATKDAAGRIVLEPAVVLTTTEHRLLQDQAFIERIRKAASEPAVPLDLDDL